MDIELEVRASASFVEVVGLILRSNHDKIYIRRLKFANTVMGKVACLPQHDTDGLIFHVCSTIKSQ